jgi:hypothetical protein
MHGTFAPGESVLFVGEIEKETVRSAGEYLRDGLRDVAGCEFDEFYERVRSAEPWWRALGVEYGQAFKEGNR